MITIPSYLQKGDTIGIVAPAGYMPFEKMQSCIETFEDWGYSIALGSTTQSASANYFSGTDAERLKDVQQMLDDKNIKAIMCARGGYGVSRLIDDLSFKKFKKNPKWIVGFSDITVFHAHLYARYEIASLHAPMAAAFNEGEFANPYVLSLKSALAGEKAGYEIEPHAYNTTGTATGTLVGGNLTLLAHLTGTRSDMNTKGKILFLEDVGEYLYNIDRMLLQLKRNGKFKKLAGLIIGGFTDFKDTERPFGKGAYDILKEHLKDADFPVCYNFPVSHAKENYALKIGVEYLLSITNQNVVLEEKE